MQLLGFDIQAMGLSLMNGFKQLVLLLPLTLPATSLVSGQYLLGLGIGDVTGPVAEVNFMGYAALAQKGTGLHMRERSRAFIIADASKPSERVVFINSDIGMGDNGVRRAIVSKLSALYPGIYSDSNIALVATHSHSGVGGYVENLLPQITSLGYVKQTADAIVDGTVRAVQRAHASLAPGTLSIGNATVLNTNINRSPSAYLENPAAERARYQYDQDKDMTVLKFDDLTGKARGLLSFFPVHGTSIYLNNTLVSTDNKGMAAYLYESFAEPNSMPGNTTFVAGFTQANVGDTSPNTLGPICQAPGKAYDGQECDFKKSTCGGTAPECLGRGPGFRHPNKDFESNRIIGTLQYEGARKIMGQTLTPVTGPVKSAHAFTKMASYTFALPNGTSVSTCTPAMGYAFAGGTTDGPGGADFTQGNNQTSQNPFWEVIKGFLTYPTAAQIACHYPKPILLNTGAAHVPYEWTPATVNVQILRVGQLVILIIPGELTTMAGRRLRESVRAKLIQDDIIGANAYVLVAGPANTYSHYITTPEEYSVQRYEGGSTIYGPNTLNAYIHKYGSMLQYLQSSATGKPSSDPAPKDESSSYITLQTGVVYDNPPIGKKFGDVLAQPSASYGAGQKASAQFVGAHPKNNLRLDGTFLTVDQLVSGQWKTVKSDSHPSTTYEWKRVDGLIGSSTVTTSWTIEAGTPAGEYRFSYYGDSKTPFTGAIRAFSGTSATFTVR